jgi:hypothetical protein
MIDIRLVAVALCRIITFFALILAGIIGLGLFYGEPALALLSFFWGRLIPDLSGREWATVVMAASAAGAVFVALSGPALILLFWQLGK